MPGPGGRVSGPGEGALYGGCLVETPSGTATVAGGTHRNGMHSCYISKLHVLPTGLCSFRQAA